MEGESIALRGSASNCFNRGGISGSGISGPAPNGTGTPHSGGLQTPPAFKTPSAPNFSWQASPGVSRGSMDGSTLHAEDPGRASSVKPGDDSGKKKRYILRKNVIMVPCCDSMAGSTLHAENLGRASSVKPGEDSGKIMRYVPRKYVFKVLSTPSPGVITSKKKPRKTLLPRSGWNEHHPSFGEKSSSQLNNQLGKESNDRLSQSIDPKFFQNVANALNDMAKTERQNGHKVKMGTTNIDTDFAHTMNAHKYASLFDRNRMLI